MSAEFDYLEADIEGHRTLIVTPTIPDNAPAEVREGLVRRRIALTTGTCPCGGTRARLPRAARRAAKRGGGNIVRLEVAHAPGCPATSEAVDAHLRGWRWAP
jgi:hypothetical protein